MTNASSDYLAALPGIDQLLRSDAAQPLLQQYGHDLVTESLRVVIEKLRRTLALHGASAMSGVATLAIVEAANHYLSEFSAPSFKPVFNLTGTVLHTNLGRAPLPSEAIKAMTAVASGASNLEFDLGKGRRGDRDDHLESRICRLTGAEAATTVNNNAAAVLLVLNTLALRKEVIVSRGELIEIGGSFRIPDVISRAGAKIREIGTTNRTHVEDFEQNISPKTAMLLKVHTSNYVVKGFTSAVSERQMANIAHKHDVPVVVDLGSGTLVDLQRYGLPHETTVSETLDNGTDIVTFSGDKLLGGPQAGIIAGRADLVGRIKRNPMKRALRVDKMTIAALEAVLRLYDDPVRLVERLPSLRLLARTAVDIGQQAQRLLPKVRSVFDDIVTVEGVDCYSQIGSGAQPGELLLSAGLALKPKRARGSGRVLERLAKAFRELPVPVVGRIDGGAFILDLRCLEDESTFVGQLKVLESFGKN
ncbi:MAG TPA: L-seryl-tRNA(Sec) selenium transferase [Gammaproteobacteria bacterium]|nr:L-seryl-tRNA(Sec) selenium transferase [Gammaproteobacteria bacterium]